ncbi:MAG TPA: hypothetical protein VFQ53_27350 [Kofleriaceae bacterium]|nr:hypothetical protein [Kofleriaceae bacterium]
MHTDVKSGIDWQDVHRGLQGIARQRAKLKAREIVLLRQAHEARIWTHFGHGSLVQYMERELGYRTHTALELVRTALKLEQLPQVSAALEAGELFPSAARELSRIATGETEAAWLAATEGKTVHEIQDMVSGLEPGDLPDAPKKPQLVKKLLSFFVGPETHALMRHAREQLEREYSGDRRMDDDELLQMILRRALETVPPHEGRPAYQVSVTTCKDCKRGWQHGAGRAFDLDPASVERACCDAEYLGDLEAEHPERVTASVTPRKRRQVHARDEHRCVVPGCRFTRHLQIHHIEFQSFGGSHAMSNIVLLCDAHHAAVHKGHLVIAGEAPDAVTFDWIHPFDRGVPRGTEGGSVPCGTAG